jgi:hypothetical protein
MNKFEEEKLSGQETQENSQSVSVADMERYHHLGKEQMRADMKGDFQKRQEVDKELETIKEKGQKERDRLLCPSYPRLEVFSDEKKGETVESLLKVWLALPQQERFKRLDRVWNELEDMQPSGEIQKKALEEAMITQQQVAADYEEFMAANKTKPLSEKENKEWEK